MDNEAKLVIKDLRRLSKSMRVMLESLEQRTTGEPKKFVKGIIPDLNVVENKIFELDHYFNKSEPS